METPNCVRKIPTSNRPQCQYTEEVFLIVLLNPRIILFDCHYDTILAPLSKIIKGCAVSRMFLDCKFWFLVLMAKLVREIRGIAFTVVDLGKSKSRGFLPKLIPAIATGNQGSQREHF